MRKALAMVMDGIKTDYEMKEIEIYRKDEADEILKSIGSFGSDWVYGYDAFSPYNQDLRIAHSACYSAKPFAPFSNKIIYFE